MPVKLTTVTQLQSYIHGVRARSEHHAETVGTIIHYITGMVVVYANLSKGITANVREGNTTNVLWFWVGSQRYALSYDHLTAEVMVKLNSVRGDVLYRWNDSTPMAAVYAAFRQL